MTGAEMQRNKEAVAAKMREKQAAGMSRALNGFFKLSTSMTAADNSVADAKKVAEGKK